MNPLSSKTGSAFDWKRYCSCSHGLPQSERFVHVKEVSYRTGILKVTVPKLSINFNVVCFEFSGTSSVFSLGDFAIQDAKAIITIYMMMFLMQWHITATTFRSAENLKNVQPETIAG